MGRTRRFGKFSDQTLDALIDEYLSGRSGVDTFDDEEGIDAADPREVQRRCRALGCPLIVRCDDGEQMFVTDCGRGPCPYCPPGFDELLVKAWCSYTGIRPGRWGVMLIGPFGVRWGPLCFG